MLIEYKGKKFNTEHTGYIGGIEQDNTVAWLKNNIKAGENYIEIGAHIGAIAVFVCDQVTGVSMLFEPFKESAKTLAENLAINYTKGHIEVVEAAVTDQVGYKDLFVAQHKNGCSFYNHDGETVKVQTTTIDAEIAAIQNDAPIVMKIDAEFSEPLIWKGMKQSLPRIRAAVMEFHYGGIQMTGRDPLDFLKEIEEDGFTIVGMNGSPWPVEELMVGKKDLLLYNKSYGL